MLENKLIGYANNYTSMALVPSPGIRDTIAEPLNRVLGKVVSGVAFGEAIE